MARTGFYDSTQDLYLPKVTLTWADLGESTYGSWDSYTTWYKELTSSTELEYTSDIIDFGFAKKVYPVVIVTARRDGATDTAATFTTDFTKIKIEAGNASDLSDATSRTLTRTVSYTHLTLPTIYTV